MAVDAALLFALLFLPLNWLVLRHFDQLVDPSYLRGCGIVICSESVIEARTTPIGEYLGRPLWGGVTFKGMQYRFDRVAEPAQRERLAAGELFLEPGLVYVLVGNVAGLVGV